MKGGTNLDSAQILVSTDQFIIDSLFKELGKSVQENNGNGIEAARNKLALHFSKNPKINVGRENSRGIFSQLISMLIINYASKQDYIPKIIRFEVNKSDGKVSLLFIDNL